MLKYVIIPQQTPNAIFEDAIESLVENNKLDIQLFVALCGLFHNVTEDKDIVCLRFPFRVYILTKQ